MNIYQKACNNIFIITKSVSFFSNVKIEMRKFYFQILPSLKIKPNSIRFFSTSNNKDRLDIEFKNIANLYDLKMIGPQPLIQWYARNKQFEANFSSECLSRLLNVISQSKYANEELIENLIELAKRKNKNPEYIEACHLMMLRAYSYWGYYHKALDFIDHLKQNGYMVKARTVTEVLISVGTNCKVTEVDLLVRACNMMLEFLENPNYKPKKGFSVVFKNLLQFKVTVNKVDNIPEKENIEKTLNTTFHSALISLANSDHIPDYQTHQSIIRWFQLDGSYDIKTNLFIDETGQCSYSGSYLYQKRITLAEKRSLKNNIYERVCRNKNLLRETENLHAFINNRRKELGENSTYHVVIDGPNAGYFYSRSKKFSIESLIKTVTKLEEIGLEFLIFLPDRYSSFRKRSNYPVLNDWFHKNKIYSSRFSIPGTDDLLGLYAALYQPEYTLFLTNDELKDHLQLINDKNLFLNWKLNHQVRMSIGYSVPHRINLIFPGKYHVSTQLIHDSDVIETEEEQHDMADPLGVHYRSGIIDKTNNIGKTIRRLHIPQLDNNKRLKTGKQGFKFFYNDSINSVSWTCIKKKENL